uniref:Uncharacterized protein n=1 Tax=Lotharella oceanica TaxID=641309 RepID=A0A7S2U3Z8_9EUKA
MAADGGLKLRYTALAMLAYFAYVFAYTILAAKFLYSDKNSLEESSYWSALSAVALFTFPVILRSLSADVWVEQPFWKWVLPLAVSYFSFYTLEGWKPILEAPGIVLFAVTSCKIISSTLLVFILPIVLICRSRGYNFFHADHRFTQCVVIPVGTCYFLAGYWRSVPWINLVPVSGLTQGIILGVAFVIGLIFDRRVHDELGYVWMGAFAATYAPQGLTFALLLFIEYFTLDTHPVETALCVVMFIKFVYLTCLFVLREFLKRIQLVERSSIYAPLFPLQLAEDLTVSAIYLSQTLNNNFAMILAFTVTLNFARDCGLIHEAWSRLVVHRKSITRTAAMMARNYFEMQ